MNSEAINLIRQGLYLGAGTCGEGWALCILDHGRPAIQFARTIKEAAAARPGFDALVIDGESGLPEGQSQAGAVLASSPEACFARLAGTEDLGDPRQFAGYMNRMDILEDYLPKDFLTSFRGVAYKNGCRADELMAAAVLAVTGALYAHDLCEVPEGAGLTLPSDKARKTFCRQKTAVVTGGAGGIGKCIADAFREQGVRVFVIDQAPGDHFVGDIADKETLERFAKSVIEECGGIDYLINNAPPVMKGIDSCSYEDFQYALAAGVTAPFYLSRLFAPYFREGACIINISSSRDRMSQPQTESYTAAKGGIAALTHAMAASFAGKVRVNSISPGWIETKGRTYEGPDALQQPAGRVGNPGDIASMVLYLCSDQAGFITGENICIDGGMTRLMIYHGDHGWTYQPE